MRYSTSLIKVNHDFDNKYIKAIFHLKTQASNSAFQYSITSVSEILSYKFQVATFFRTDQSHFRGKLSLT